MAKWQDRVEEALGDGETILAKMQALQAFYEANPEAKAEADQKLTDFFGGRGQCVRGPRGNN